MHIATLGAGEVAVSLARQALLHGHTVALASRHSPDDLEDTIADLGKGASAVTLTEAAGASVVLLAVPWTAVEALLDGLPDWQNRILIDATNPFASLDPLELADLGDRSASGIVAAHATGARVVKAFNNLTMTTFDKGPTSDHGNRRVLFLSGDDQPAKVQIATLIESLGYAPIDLGGLDSGGRIQQAGGPLAGRDILVAG